MEEIDDVDGTSYDPFIADAIANEGDLNLTEEQKRNFKKVSFIYKQIILCTEVLLVGTHYLSH